MTLFLQFWSEAPPAAAAAKERNEERLDSVASSEAPAEECKVKEGDEAVKETCPVYLSRFRFPLNAPEPTLDLAGTLLTTSLFVSQNFMKDQIRFSEITSREVEKERENQSTIRYSLLADTRPEPEQCAREGNCREWTVSTWSSPTPTSSDLEKFKAKRETKVATKTVRIAPPLIFLLPPSLEGGNILQHFTITFNVKHWSF